MTVTVLPKRIGLILPAFLVLVSNQNRWTPMGVLKLYIPQRSRRNLWRLISESDRLLPPFGILTGQRQPEEEVDSILMIRYSDHIGLNIQKHILRFPLTLRPLWLWGHNCTGIHWTIAHATAAATTAKSVGIPLIIVVPLTLTPSERDE